MYAIRHCLPVDNASYHLKKMTWSFEVSECLFRPREMVSVLASCEIPSSPDCGRSLINAAGLGP